MRKKKLKILCCQLRSFGDVVRTFPVVSEIKKRYGHHISFVCFEEMLDTCKLNSEVDDVIIVPRLYSGKNTHGNTRLINCSDLEDTIDYIKKEKFDVFIDFHGVFQSALIGNLSNIPTRIGKPASHSKDGAHLFYTQTADLLPSLVNKFEVHLAVAQTILPELRINYEKRSTKHEQVVLIPGSSAIGRLKRWGYKNFSQLADMLSNDFETIKIILGPEEHELEQVFEFNGTNISTGKVKNLLEFDSLLHGVSCIIGNDTSFLHLGIYREIPTFMILGPTIPTINGPPSFSPGHWHSLQSSCLKACKVWSGVCDNDHICMKQMKAEEVYKEFSEFYSKL